MENTADSPAFSGYQKFVVAMLAFLQFTVILDFMIISPLGAMLIPTLHITPSQFGWVVSVYAFSAGASGLLAAGFADKYDRKKLLLFFYAGFIFATLMCGLAPSFSFLVAARTLTGLFGGVIGSVVFAITADLFPLEMRGRVMGFVQTAFAASQILGLPIGLFLANRWGWHSPFFMIVAVSSLVGVVIIAKLKPIDAHLKLHPDRNAFHHLLTTVSTPRYLFAFAATAFLSIGGFMLMPFGSTFTVNNLGISIDRLPMIYLITGCCSIFIGPLVGRASDRFGKYPTFVFGTCVSVIMVLIYTHLGVTPLAGVIVVNTLMFIGIFSRMIPSQALMSAVPEPASRGSFMSVSSSMQQIAGGIASVVAGLIVVQRADGQLEHFPVLGYVLIGTSCITIVMVYFINQRVMQSQKLRA
jgi:predicted MFS family arabinose efflux permease